MSVAGNRGLSPIVRKDGLGDSTYLQRINIPAGMTDTQAISNLRAADQIYKNSLSYSTPAILSPLWSSTPSGYMAPGTYNSNSYISGLFKAVNIPLPELHTNGGFQVPGYSNPVPLPFSAGVIKRKKP